jgi:hypothetical protein
MKGESMVTESDEWVDGNELAGALREIFAVDLTVARGRCAGCGDVREIARLRVYDRAPGLVARCPGCTAVLLRLVRAPGRAWLDLSGLTCLEIALPEPASEPAPDLAV